jgi:hypothetical protein
MLTLKEMVLPNLDEIMGRLNRPRVVDSKAQRVLLLFAIASTSLYVLLLFIASVEFQSHWASGSLSTAWPGLLVSASFCPVAAWYYLNVFAGVSVKELKAPWTEGVLRLNSCFYAVPIGLALLVRPQWWPFCSAAGVLMVALNNLLCELLVSKTESALRSTDMGLRVPPSFEKFRVKFTEWWHHTLVYGSSLLLIGAGLATGHLHDEKAYAFLVVLVNAKMLFYNCIGQAQLMKLGLAWSFDTMRAVGRYEKWRAVKVATSA